MTAIDSSVGFYRFRDLQELGICGSRPTLHDMQVNAGFPRPLKFGRRHAVFSKAEVDAWLSARAAERETRNKSEGRMIAAE